MQIRVFLEAHVPCNEAYFRPILRVVFYHKLHRPLFDKNKGFSIGSFLSQKVEDTYLGKIRVVPLNEQIFVAKNPYWPKNEGQGGK